MESDAAFRIELKCRTPSWCLRIACWCGTHTHTNTHIGVGCRKTGLKSYVCKRGWRGMAAGAKTMRGSPMENSQSTAREAVCKQTNVPPSLPFSIRASLFLLPQHCPRPFILGYGGTRAQADLAHWAGRWKRGHETWALGRGEESRRTG